MEKTIMIGNMEQVSRQRNLFLILLLIAMTTAAVLSLRLLTREEKIILVPGLNQEVWVSKEGVSASYLEEESVMFLSCLLDLDSDSIDWKRQRLLKRVSQSEERYMKSLVDYFAVTKEKYKQFSLSTHFAAKELKINQKNLTVRASGQLSSRYGERGYESIPAIYELKYEWIAGGKLMLTEFVKLSKDEISYDKAGN